MNTDQLTARIQMLPERQFAQLCNDLLAAEAASYGIPRAHLELTLNTAEPEGGLDARAEKIPFTVGRLIPAGTVGYQYKSGKQKKSSTRVAREDIAKKPRVVELLRQGGTFVYLAAWDRASNVESDIRAAAGKLGIEIGIDKLVFVTSHTVAQLLQAYPTLIARYFGLDVNLLTLEQWGAHAPLLNPYQVDDVVSEQLAGLRVMIESGRGPVRLVGAPGDGKTRLVLEALRGSELATSVLYSPQREYVTAGLVGYLRSTPDVQCTLVIDEVDDAGADELNLLFASMPAGVRLVTIGQDPAAPHAGTVRVQGLSEEVLVRAISAIATGLDPEIAREIARACHRSPKLAVLIAGRIAEQPDLASPHRLLTDGHIQRTLDRYLGVNPADRTWQALSTFALLQRVGWTEDAEEESEILFRAVGLQPREARQLVQQIHDRTGIAPRAGRFRYVSPAILGDYLAARQLGVWSQAEIRAFLTSLTPPMARSFALRVRRMAQVLENRRAVEEVVLGEHGPFRGLSDLGEGGFAALLPTFAAVFPQATLNCLHRLVDNTSEAELLAERRARRPLVQALTDLLWRADTFPRAALLLLRLAANENETWANNASGTWNETFQINLGRTAAGADERLRVLRTAIASNNAAERRLAASALGKAVEVRGQWRAGSPPSDVEGMPAEAWRPVTWGDWYRVLEAYFALLGQLLTDSRTDVAIEAAKALRVGTSAAVQFPVTAAWITAALSARGAEYTVRSELMAGIDDRTERHNYLVEELEEGESEAVIEEGLNDPQTRRTIEERLTALQSVAVELRGDSFSTRFRWAVQREPHFGYADYAEAERAKNNELRALMQEAVADPALLEDEWEWLAALEFAPGRWAHELGFVDRERRLGRRVLELAENLDVAPRWLAEYEMGYAAGGAGDKWVDGYLAELHQRGVASEIMLHVLYHAGTSSFRAKILTQLFETGSLPGEALSRLVYTDWTELDEPAAIRLVEAATVSQTPQAITAGIQFLAVLRRRGRLRSEPMLKLALGLVRQSLHPTGTGREPSDWGKVAMQVVDRDPSGVAAAAVRQLSHARLGTDRDILAVLKRAWEVGDRQSLFLDIIGPSVLRQDEGGWRLRDRLEHFDWSAMDLDLLATWIDEDPDTRARVVAEIAGVPIGAATDLHEMLLDRYGSFGTGDTFFGGLISGVHSGSHAGWLALKRDEAQRWIEDSRPSVRAWAEEAVRSLDAMISRERNREDEDAFR